MSLSLSDNTLFRTECYINGQWCSAESSARLAIKNPATGDVIAEVAKVGAEETRRAIEAAETAMTAWRAVPAKQRASILRNWFNLVMENQEDLARIMTVEQGKTLAESRGEVAYGASYIEWFAEQAKRIDGGRDPRAGPR